MTLQDLMLHAEHITGLNLGQEVLLYYNELIDYLIASYPEKISKPHTEIVKVSGSSDRRYTIPQNWASVLKVKNSAGRRVYCEIIDDTIVLPYLGTFEILYTKKPKFMKSLDEPLEHNRIFDICIPYYFAWKMSERDQLSANKIQKYQSQFLDYLSIAIKSRAKQGLKYIKTQPFV